MMRGTLNIRIRNEIVPGVEGGMTNIFLAERLCLFTMAMKYVAEKFHW
jgi:aconitase A